MSKESQSTSKKPGAKQPTKAAAPAALLDGVEAQAVNSPLPRGGEAGFESQAASLGAAQLAGAQRLELASAIGRLQGNHHLQRVIASAAKGPAASGPGAHKAPRAHSGPARKPRGSPAAATAEPVTMESDQSAASLGPPSLAPAQPPPKGNGRARGAALQRQEAEGEEAPTPEQKAAALAAARAAMAQADQAASRTQQEVGKSKSAQAAEKQATQAARSKLQAAEGAQPSAPKIHVGGNGDAAEPRRAELAAGPIEAPLPAEGAPGERAPKSPQEDPGFQAVASKVKAGAARLAVHPPAGRKARQAHAAAEAPSSERESKAQAAHVGELEAAGTPAFNKTAFKAQLISRIHALAPKTAAQADGFKEQDRLAGLKGEMQSKVEAEKSASAGPLKDKAAQGPDTSPVEAKPVTPLPPTQPGPPPQEIEAQAAAPKPKATREVEAPLKQRSQSLEAMMAEAKVSQEQLQRSNEPEMMAALEAKRQAQAHAQAAPQSYRAFEQTQLSQAQNEAAAVAGEKTQAMHGAREELFHQVYAEQGQTKSSDEAKRAEIAAQIQAIYGQTKAQVERVLADMDGKVGTVFEEGASEAKRAFEDYVDAATEAWKQERYGGWLGWTRWLKDKFTMHPGIMRIADRGRQLFMAKMEAVIDNVVGFIARGMNEAKAEVAKGKRRIEQYLAGLPLHLRDIGQQAAENIQAKFDELENSIHAKQEALIETLANKYQEHLQSVDARIEQIRSENQGFYDKAKQSMLGTIRTILRLKDMLLNVLGSGAQVIETIIKDPIGFLGNLIAGIKQGFSRFVGNIGAHLQAGLIAWLTGALGSVGIQMPEEVFSLEGIFSLAVQILGLTWDYIRRKAVKLLGEPVVQALETGFTVFQILRDEGPAGLWQFVQEEFRDLKETVIDQIKTILVEQVIKAGIKWVLGLLSPAGALVKAVMVIIDIVTFFIQRAGQIMELVQAIINSIAAIARGSVSAMAAAIESALARALPVVIGFLASLLGLGGLAKRVVGVIRRVRRKMDRAIDKLLLKAKSAARKLLRRLGMGKKKAMPPADDPQANAAAKAQARQQVAQISGRPFEDERSLKAAVRRIESQLQPAGLESLEVKPRQGKPGTYDIIARQPEEVGDARVGEEGTVDMGSIRSYRPSWRKTVRAELAVIYPHMHAAGTSRLLSDFHRRHMTSFDQIRDDILNGVHGASFRDAAMTLANKGFPPAQLTNDAIVAAVKAYLRDRFNNLVNVFVGEADENVERGRKMAQAKRKMRQAMRDGDRESFREAYEAYRQQAFDPEPIDYFYDAFRDLRNRAHVRPRE